MKKLALAVLALCFLGGCSASFRLENQAHAITMGIDYTEKKLKITIQVPSFGGQTAGAGGQKSASSYLIYSASGEDFPKALNILKASLPQNLNLTHLKSIVFSKDFAESEIFGETIEIFMNMFSVSGNAVVIVTRSAASLFIESQQPAIGMRLSQIVPSMLEYHVDTGLIPECTLSMLYAGVKGVYSTSVCALSDTGGGDIDENAASYLAGEMDRAGKNKNEFMGAALFDRNGMKMMINGRETQLMHLLEGNSIRQANFTMPENMRLSIRKKPKVTVNTDSVTPVIEIRLFLDCAPLMNAPDTGELEKALEAEFLSLIDMCRREKLEPFGFAGRAAMNFRTMEEWIAYDWLEAFSRAQVSVQVELTAEM